MKKILFLIHDLGPGGAEKVLVNLVNNMNTEEFDITVMTLFDVGVNRQFLSSRIKYKYCFKRMIRGNSHLMKLFSPQRLHKMLIKENYDIEISYLEGPCARIISGCPNKHTKLISWIHIEQYTKERASSAFRSYNEAVECYNRFHGIVCVSNAVKQDFTKIIPVKCPVNVLYNTNESDKIIKLATETVQEIEFRKDEIKLVGVGKLLKSKGFDRVLRIGKKILDEGYPIHIYILGTGPEEENLRSYIAEQGMEKNVDLLGYQTNPYKYVTKCDLFVCASHAEGFSTAATEALIVGTPVCTVDVSGMKEMLGENNEYGIVVKNSEEELYLGIKNLLYDPEMLIYYRDKALERGRRFNTNTTVRAVENYFNSILI